MTSIHTTDINSQVSSEPVTRTDVIKLGEQLDLRLRESRAKMLGICPIRRELFTQCFGTYHITKVSQLRNFSEYY